MPEIRVEALRREYRAHNGARALALDHLGLTVADGELLVVLGPSGSGKSTLLRLIAGLETPDGGGVWIGGRPVAGMAPRERGVAMVMQDHPLFPHLDVERNLVPVPGASGLSRAETAVRVGRVARSLGLEALLRRRPQELSGGERQRVGLGAAWVTGAGVLLLDEPLAQVDALGRGQLRLEIRRLQREFRTTVLHVTHDQCEAMALADRLAVLREGRLEQCGTPMELYRDPANTFVARFLGSPGMNLLAGRVRGSATESWLELEGGGVLSLSGGQGPSGCGGGRVVLGVRPEHARLCAPGTGRGVGVVEASEPLGHEVHVHVRVGQSKMVVRVGAGGGEWVGAGQSVGVDLDLGGVRWFDGETGRRWVGGGEG